MNVRRILERRTCGSVRKALDEWLDQRSATPIPEHAGRHMRNCARCRQYVAQWHAIELQMRALSEEWPARPMPETLMQFVPRHDSDALGISARRWRLAVQCAIVVVALTAFGIFLRLMAYSKNERVMARTPPVSTPATMKPAAPLGPDLPVAATR